MAVTPMQDKTAIQAILSTDPYLTEYLGFSPKEIYRVKATDELLGTNDAKNKLKQQIYIYNTQAEETVNPLIYGIVYEVDVSVPYAKNGTADLAIEQIIALLDGREILNVHELEVIDMPTVLSSETSLYQIGVRFVCYISKLCSKKVFLTQEKNETEGP